MSENHTVVRDPDIFSNPFTSDGIRYPIELVDGSFCGDNRNARTTPYTTHSPYHAKSRNINNLFNVSSSECLYGFHEDACGGIFGVYKPNFSGLTILDKLSLVGSLYYSGDTEWEIDITQIPVLEVQVFDYIIVIRGANNTVYIGDCRTGNICEIPWGSQAKAYCHGCDTYIWTDRVLGEFELLKYNESSANIEVITDLLTDTIESFDLRFSSNGVEVVYSDGSLISIGEYSFCNEVWTGVTFPHPIDGDIVGAQYNGDSWSVFYQDPTCNRISGVCIKPNPKVVPETIEKRKGDLYLEY